MTITRAKHTGRLAGCFMFVGVAVAVSAVFLLGAYFIDSLKGDSTAKPQEYRTYRLQRGDVVVDVPYPHHWFVERESRTNTGQSVSWTGPKNAEYGTWPRLYVELIAGNDSASCASELSRRSVDWTEAEAVHLSLPAGQAMATSRPSLKSNPTISQIVGMYHVACVPIRQTEKALAVVEVQADGTQRPMAEDVFNRVLDGLTIVQSR